MPVALTIALAAFLTFQVQFILGRALLPPFGGTPAVWTTSLLFFQVALLVGYAWAHQVAARPVRAQRRLHLLLAVTATVALFGPVAIGATPLLAWIDGAGSTRAPILAVCSTLALACGVPFVTLAATSPLLQAWAVREAAARGDNRPIQRLYAVSNAGSLLGLLSYPFVFERWLTLTQQAWLWTGGFVVFLVALAICARRVPETEPATASASSADAATVGADTAETSTNDTLFARVLWFLLPAAGSALMLSVSNAICQDVAAVPLLWVAPLAVYLVTYILPFRNLRWVPRHDLTLAALGACAATLAITLWTEHFNALASIAVLLGLLGALGLLLHGEVARLAPAGRRLPHYYLALAAGGALGGAFVSLAAPHWFTGYWELPVTLAASWSIVLAAWAKDRTSPLRAGAWWGPVLLFAVIATLIGMLETGSGTASERVKNIAVFSVVGVVVGCGATFFARRLRHGAVTAIAVLGFVTILEAVLAAHLRATAKRLLARERNFFGLVLVVETGEPNSLTVRHELVHGRISHGLQFRDPVLRRMPTTYYTATSGASRGVAWMRAKRERRPLRFGAVGLGAGTLATLTRPGDQMRFYEINPAVIRFADGPTAQFTNLREAQGAIDVVEGDGRKELERELAAGKPGRFDVLFLDAFSSDAVPAHLLTVEAFQLYAKHLATDGGLIVLNVTNRYLDLAPLAFALGREMNWTVRRVASAGDPPLKYPSEWVVFATDPALLPTETKPAEPPRILERAWTDQFSSLLPLLR